MRDRLKPAASPPRVDERADGLAFAAVLASVFTASLGYGVVLPLLPAVVNRLMPGAPSADASWHAGTVAGIYMLFIFLFAPVWGRISDRSGRRPVILVGLLGYAATLGLFVAAQSMTAVYVARALAGAFVAAIPPIASAFVSETAREGRRPRQLAWLGAASLLGFVVGPAMSGGLLRLMTALGQETYLAGASPTAVPLSLAAVLALLVAMAVYRWLPGSVTVPSRASSGSKTDWGSDAARSRLAAVLSLSLLVTFGLGSFEMGITLQMAQSARFDPSDLAVMFAECSLVMIAVQVIAFSPAIRPIPGHLLVVPAFLAMALGLSLLPASDTLLGMVVAVGLISASAGLIMPALTHMVSLQTVLPLGVALGVQTALASAGQAAGSVAAGALYGSLADGLFWVGAGSMVFAALLSVLLLRRTSVRPAT